MKSCIPSNFLLCSTFLLLLSFVKLVRSHGILVEPGNRASLWRLPEFDEYNTTKCYTDNQLSCGGFGVLYEQNGGKCGVCGDPFQMPRPRDNENGGSLGKSIIARNYTSGQLIQVSVELTANHLGTFAFHLCRRGDYNNLEEEACFDQYPLELADGSGSVYHLPSVKMQPSGTFNITLQLPAGLRCSFCTFRWHYRTANSWGFCADGVTIAAGCGNQEIFRNCADVRIT